MLQSSLMPIFRIRLNCFPEMIALLDQGYDVVSAQRVTRSGEGIVKRYTASMFYWIIQKTVDKRIQPEVGDFRMFSRRAIDRRAAASRTASFYARHGCVAWFERGDSAI